MNRLTTSIPSLALVAALAVALAATGCGQTNVETPDTGVSGADVDDASGETDATDAGGGDAGGGGGDSASAGDTGGGGGDDPGLKTLCDPCTLSSQCGDSSSRCVDHDGNGAFCAMACDGDKCPIGYECRSVTTMEGTKSSQCVPEGDSGKFGACNCSTEAIKAGKKTVCSVTSSLGGKDVTCYGERVCEKVGLSDCSAAAPAKEVCDGLDNDCDGSTDGGACDDGDPCTADTCDGKTGKCSSKPSTGPCDDGDPCTTGETCSGGTCAGGIPNPCDDKNACTTDVCEKGVGCKHVPVEGCKACSSSSQCNDSDPCTNDSCSNKVCQYTAKSCDDGDSCTLDTCSAETGGCGATFDKAKCGGGKGSKANPLALPFKAGFSCGDDATALWTPDKPMAGGLGWAFDDTPAKPVPAFKPCSLNFNNGKDFKCPAGATSVSGAVMSPWFDARGVPSIGNLRMRVRYGGTYERNNNDELHFEVTTDGKTWSTIYDANGMTNDSQWSTPNINLGNYEGKVFRVRIRFFTTNCTANDGTGPFIDQVWIKDDACYTHEDCTGGSKCSVRKCWNHYCQAINPCNDFNPCTSDSCSNVDGSCKHSAAKDGGKCEDGDSCTSDTACKGGQCVGGTSLKDGEPCSDGNGCSGVGVCKSGACAAAVKCDDGNPCTVDTCDKQLGKCTSLPAAGSCDDGNKCTTSDTCTKGLCQGKPNTCDDGDACTSDACDLLTGKCSNTADACDDGDSCTVDSCSKGTCSHKADAACATAAPMPYSQPFDCGGKHGWALTGTTGGPSWAVDGSPASVPPFTGKCSLNFNDGKDFQCPKGASKVEGTATSPWIDASKAKTTYMRLRFRISGRWESNNDDEFHVQASTDDKNWSTLYDTSHTNPSAWYERSLGIGQYKGKKFKVRFRFFTKDCNDNAWPGPFIDDVRILDEGCVIDADCEDGNACTTHTCNSSGSCSNTGKNCNDDNPCTLDTCLPSTGKCANPFRPDSYGCSDGDACTSQDKCHSGKCAGYATKCNDGDACTVDACDKKIGCTYTPKCDDGDACTADTCDPATLKCSSKPVASGTACDDGDACTGGEVCGSKGCVGGGVVVGAASNTSFSTISDVAVHTSGAVFFTSIGQDRIYKLEGTKGVVIAGVSSGYADGPGTQARFKDPRSLDIDAAGQIVIADTGNHRIRWIDGKGVVSTLAGSTAGNKEGPGGLLNQPYGVALDSKGQIVVADTYNYRIRRVTKSGSVNTLAGSSGGFKDGPAAQARFNRPMGIDFDAQDNLYIADAYNYRIRKLTPGGQVSTVAGTGQGGHYDGLATVARFNRPWDVQVAAGGALLVGDAYNYRVRRITPTGLVSTLAGQQSGGYTNGPGPISRFNRPTGVAVHKDGTVYVADMYNGRVRTITIAAGGKVSCDDGDACTVDACDKLTGKCSNTPKTACDDGDKCTDDLCNPNTGACKSTPKPCDDGDSCTADSCDKATGDCKHSPSGACSLVVTKEGYKQSFACGSKSLSGWSFGGSGGPKWAVDKTPAKPKAYSGDCSLNFNNGTDYACAAGAKKVSGVAETPWLDTSKVGPAGTIRVRFRYSGRWETNNNDELYFEVTKDGKTWSKIGDLSWTSTTSWGLWNSTLNGYGGGKLKIRFRFETTDCDLNVWSGPYIDDLEVIDQTCSKDADCDDGSACTKDTCASNGVCSFGGISCNDGNPCTNDSCNKDWGCANKPQPDGSGCSDSDTCTTGDTCLANKCVGVASGKDGDTCSDSSNCTGGDTCKSGKCSGVNLCTDSNPCTVDTCKNNNCSFVKDGCDDGKPCTKDWCDVSSGGCQHADACDDGDSCTTDSCEAKTGKCTHVSTGCKAGQTVPVPFNAGFECNGSGKTLWTIQNVSGGIGWGVDATPAVPKTYQGSCSLNVNDGAKLACKAGQTKLVTYAISPWIDATGVMPLDNRLYARFRAAGSVGGSNRVYRLEVTTNGTSWSNIYNLGSHSTSSWSERLASLTGYAGKKFRLRFRFEISCSNASGTGPFIDALRIRDERCSSGADCDDGNPCTHNTCQGGNCSYPGINCNDDNPCTYDTCSTTYGGCQNRPRTDNYSCGSNFGCVEHRCYAGKCTEKAKAEGQTCNDGDSCTTGETCKKGKCAGTLTAKAGVPCSDGDRCTTDDSCGTGGCSGKVGQVSTTPVGNGSLSSPSGVAISATGQVYVTSLGHHRVRRVEGGKLVDFAGSSGGFLDGAKNKARFNQPWGLDIDAKGQVFVADMYNHRIRRIDAAGTVSTLAGSKQGYKDGKGAAAEFYRPHDVVVDKQGFAYVADAYNHRIRRVGPDGTVVTLAGGNAGFADGKGGAAKFNRPSGVALDAKDVLFVADTYNSRIRRVEQDGTVTTFSGTGSSSHTDGGPKVARFNRPYGISFGAGQFWVADYYNHDVRRVDAAGQVFTVTGRQGYGFTDGVLSGARFAYPTDAAVDSKGVIWVADRSNSKLRQIVLGGKVSCDDGMACTKDVCDSGNGRCDNGPKDCDDGNACTLDTCNSGNNACVHQPYGCDDGDPCTTDSCDKAAGCKHVKKGSCESCSSHADCDDADPCTTDSCSKTSGCSHAKKAGCTGCTDAKSCDDGNGCTVDSCSGGKCSHKPGPVGAWCNDGDLCTGDDHCEAGQCVASLAVVERVNGEPGKAGVVDGAKNNVRWTTPYGAAWHPGLAQLLVAGGGDHRVRRVRQDGAAYRLSGYSKGYGESSNYTSSSVRYNTPTDVAIAPDGRVYIADQGNHCIRRFGMVGSLKSETVSGNGKAGAVNGVGTKAQLSSPTGLAINKAGVVFVADRGNHRIRQINPTTLLTTTLAGGAQGFADGKGGAAKFNAPTGLDVDGKGEVFVADRGNQRIRRISPAGVVTTVAGKVSGFVDGLGGAARFKAPADVLVLPDGALYVADSGNHAVRRVSLSGHVSTVFGGKPGSVVGGLGQALVLTPWGLAHGPNGSVYVVGQGAHTLRRIVPSKSVCGDGDSCVGDTCDALTGKCVHGPALGDDACDDNNPCTADLCLPWSGSCLHTPVAGTVSCGGGKVCVAGACESVKK